MNVSLRLRHLRDASGPAVAWFIPGDGPRAWLGEMEGWRVPASRITLYPVPRSARDRSCRGVLALISGDNMVHPSPQVHGYRSATPGFFLPVDGQLDPPIQACELAQLCQYQVYVFHPQSGLVGLDAEDIIRVDSLLTPPGKGKTDWTCPHPGIGAPMALSRVIRFLPDNPEEILDQGQDDISHKEMTDLPSVPGEPGTSATADSLRRLRLHLSNLGLRLTSLSPPTSPTRTWVNGFEDFFLKHRSQALGGMGKSRNRELFRLMDLMLNDPDEGLKYAIPLDSTGARGLAQSFDDRLTRRDVNFSLDHAGGGNMVVNWNTPSEIVEELRRLYIKAANSELAAGQFRRAAYIFSRLLGDNHSAAQALKEGRHFQEAATLFREHLNQPLVAAECLAEGGLLVDAAALYEELEEFEKAGDLRIRLADEEAAHINYRQAVTQAISINNTFAAATLLDGKLRAPDEALELLASTWPLGNQPEECLGMRFNILGRLGRHHDTLDLVEHLTRNTKKSSEAEMVVRALTQLNGTYPDTTVRTRAADGARVTAGNNLPQATPMQVTSLTTALQNLNRNDSLLVRDTQRFDQAAKEKAKATIPFIRPVAPTSLPPSCQVIMMKELEVPESVHWSAGHGSPRGFLACGFMPGSLVAIRKDWNGPVQRVDWDLPIVSGSAVAKLECRVDLHTEKDVFLLATCTGQRPDLTLQKMTVQSDDGTVSLKLGRPAWLPPDVICINSGPSRSIWALRRMRQGLHLFMYSTGGALRTKLDLGARATEEADRLGTDLPCQIVTNGPDVFVTIGSWLFLYSGQLHQPFKLPSEALGVTLSGQHQKQRLAIRHTQGASILWCKNFNLERVAMDQPSPLVLFLPTGALVVVGTEGRVYRTKHDEVIKQADFKIGLGRPKALMQGGARNRFAILYDDGKIILHKVDES